MQTGARRAPGTKAKMVRVNLGRQVAVGMALQGFLLGIKWWARGKTGSHPTCAVLRCLQELGCDVTEI